MAAPLQGQQNTGYRKTCGKGVKRPEIIIMACSTPRRALWQGSPACRKNGRLLTACVAILTPRCSPAYTI